MNTFKFFDHQKHFVSYFRARHRHESEIARVRVLGARVAHAVDERRNIEQKQELNLKGCHHHHARLATLMSREGMKALQSVYALGLAIMHAFVTRTVTGR